MLWGVPYALLLAAGALPLILFLHSLKPKGIRIGTAALFIWERVLKERPLATRLGWLLRKNLLLILQLIAAALLVATLADPSLLYLGASPGDSVVVIDLSASMKAKGTSGTRFEGARRELLALVDALPAGRKMMLIGAGPEARLIVPPTSDKARLREAGRRLAATDAPGRVKEAILLAHAFLKRGSSDGVVVISDGAFAGAEEFMRSAAHLRFIKVEGGVDNIGIVGFEIRRHPDRPAPVEVMVHVRNFMPKRGRVPLALKLGEKQLVQEIVEIAANGRKVLIYPIEGSLGGALVARLEIDDERRLPLQA